MDQATVAPEQVQPTSQEQPVSQPDVQAQTNPEPHLEQQGEQTAPAPTSGQEPGGESTSSQQEPISADEYLRMKQEYEALQQTAQEKEELLTEIRRVAEEQKAQAAHQKTRAEIQKQVSDLMRQRGVEDDEVAAAISEAMFGRIDETRNAFQQQMTDYQRQTDEYVQGAVWAAHGPGFAEYLIKENGLDPVLKQQLMSAKSEQEMTSIAANLKAAQDFYKNQAYERTVQEQEAQRRNSGVDTITGTNSGPISGERLDHRNQQQMRDVLRRVAGF